MWVVGFDNVQDAEGEIRFRLGDERTKIFVAKDGSLLDVGFDSNCGEWIDGWVNESMKFNEKDNPKAYTDYFLTRYQVEKFIATIREANIASWKTIEKAGFRFVERKMYKDINDKEEKLYRFYEITL